jgi:hypothetical protein
MKKKLTFLFCLMVFASEGFSQFMGGNGDGFHFLKSGSDQLNNSLLYCTGGNHDGFFKLSTGPVALNNQNFYCSGGNQDGFNKITAGSINMSYPYHILGGNNDGADQITRSAGLMYDALYCYLGGNHDGFHLLNTGSVYLSSPSIYSSGGNGDGFQMLNISGYMFSPTVFTGGVEDGSDHVLYLGNLFGQNFYCMGGYQDGSAYLKSAAKEFGRGIWLGTASNSWLDAANWKPNTIPDVMTDVYIPAGCLYYPKITAGKLTVASTEGNYVCNSLIIGYGASFSSSRFLYAHGDVVIAGLYQADNSLNNTIVLNDGSKLTITSTGLMKIGNQSSGTDGQSDLKIDGGQLLINGGTLEIDDQFNLVSGSFMMTSGTLFAHKYGQGSAYSDSGPGTFYVGPLGSGQVSGGTVKLVGRATRLDSSAVNIKSPAFNFTGTSTLEFVQGVNLRADLAEIRTASGAVLNNLHFDAPYRRIYIGSDAIVNGNITVEPESRLIIYQGKTVTLTGIP